MKKSVIGKYKFKTNRTVKWFKSAKREKRGGLYVYYAADRHVKSHNEFFLGLVDKTGKKCGKVVVPEPWMAWAPAESSMLLGAELIAIEALGVTYDFDKRAIILAEVLTLKLTNGKHFTVRSEAHCSITTQDGKLRSNLTVTKSIMNRFQAYDHTFKSPKKNTDYMTLNDWGWENQLQSVD